MTSIVSSLLNDTETAQRIAHVLLKHTKPRNKEDAIKILSSRIGVYTNGNHVIIKEAERYFS